MHTETNETPVTTAEAVRLVDVVMADDPRELRDLGLMTVYKNPRTNVLSVSEIAIGRQNSQTFSSDFFSHAASTGYLVQLSIPEDCYNEVLQSLKDEPLITKINDVKTVSGQTIENNISDMVDNARLEQTSCSIM